MHSPFTHQFLVSVFVDGRDRSAIMKDMEARIERKDIVMERTDAIKVQRFRRWMKGHSANAS